MSRLLDQPHAPARPAPTPVADRAADALFARGGELGALMRAFDWAQTPLGPVEDWPQSLKTCVRIMLTSRQPIWIGWGEELTYLYNDPYKAIIGGKHPEALGKPTSVVWHELWDVIGPMLATAMRGDEGIYVEAQRLIMERYGYEEETYYTFSYSPVPNNQGGTGGIICANTDDTARVIGERQMALIRELAASSAESRTARDACALAAKALESDPYDLPFALIYLVDPTDRSRTMLAGHAGVLPEHPIASDIVKLGEGARWPFDAVARERAMRIVELDPSIGALPTGAWHRPPERIAVVPIAPSGETGRAGFLVAGLNPFRKVDPDYTGFLGLVAGHISAAVGNADAYEQERNRAEALAALDRAKTTFFSNVSHEFRTPLALLIGPAEDALADSETVPVNAERLAIIHRNALRLLKLVNTLLDFSRIEAGRAGATYEPTDLGPYTADVASSFRSAIERAGLRLVVESTPLPYPVYLDRDMWEKIVLNLLSNAFKHTFDGEIAVSVVVRDERAVLEVRDTGVGIPPDQLPHIFERFHRVPNARSRTHEGTGIGLALVQELVKLHGGDMHVESAVGRGTTFSVAVPFGTAHLAQARIAAPRERGSATGGSSAYIEEALRWLPPSTPDLGLSVSVGPVDSNGVEPRVQASAYRVLVADDNADMRDYVTRLLAGHGYAVDGVADGRAALDAVHDQVPDVVLTDVMMPGLDGVELLRALRTDARTTSIPVILLSARAGEESRVDGLRAGADDYLVKPFSARELLARVDAQVRRARDLAHERRKTEEQERLFAAIDAERRARREAEEARAAAEDANRAKSAFLAAMSHELRTPLNAIGGHAQLLGMGLHGPLNIEQREAVDRIERNERHLLSLINDVLNFAKIEAGRVQYAIEDVPLRQTVTSMLGLIEPQIAAGHLATEVRIAEEVHVCADRERLGQILLNLLSNAIKFTPPGGSITIDMGRRARLPLADGVVGDPAAEAAHELDAPPGFVFLRVSDTGIGIPRDKQATVFDPFVQVHRRMTSPTEGTGLGLAISRDLARGMGGDLRVRSTEGEGSTFTLTLVTAGAGPVVGSPG